MTYNRGERLLTVTGLGISFGEKVVLRDVNLSVDNLTRPGVHQGQCIALLGPSGIGKTQLFRAIAGLQRPTAGTITYTMDGKTQRPAVAGEIGVLQQAYPLMHHRTVLSNLRLAGRKLKDADAQIDVHLKHYGLLDKKGSYPSELSGGQRQRIAIIQQLLCGNHILLMDEPFSGLDPIAKERVYDTVHTVTTAHELNTVIFTTHDITSAVRLSDEIWILGREQGKPGATVIKRLSMIDRGLAWDPNITKNPAFWSTVNEINELFHHL